MNPHVHSNVQKQSANNMGDIEDTKTVGWTCYCCHAQTLLELTGAMHQSAFVPFQGLPRTSWNPNITVEILEATPIRNCISCDRLIEAHHILPLQVHSLQSSRFAKLTHEGGIKITCLHKIRTRPSATSKRSDQPCR